MPAPEQVAAFQQRLIARGVPAFLRRPRGSDIYAACGQLKRTVDSETQKPSRESENPHLETARDVGHPGLWLGQGFSAMLSRMVVVGQ